MKVNVKDVYIKIILLFPLFTLFQNYLGPINKILFSVLIFFQIYILFKKKVQKRTFCLLSITLFLEIIAVLNTESIPYNFNDIFYFPFIVSFYSLLCENRYNFFHLICKNGYFLRFIIKLWSFCVLLSMLFPLSYNTSWGEGTYFVSFSGDSFRLCPTAFMILCLIMFEISVEKRKKYFWYSIIPLFCFFSSGTRTYFAVGMILFVIVWYSYLKNKKYFLFTLIPLFFVSLIVFINSPILDKILATNWEKGSYFDYWGTITSGRSIFWEADLKYFMDSTIFEKFFGLGFNTIYEVNEQAIGQKIWAHNDFIQIIYNYGLTGLFLYLYLFICFYYEKFRIRFRGFRSKGTWITIGIVSIWFFIAFINMFYTYICTVIGFAVLVECVNYSRLNSNNIFR